MSGGEIEDISTKLGIDRTTGGRAVVSGHIFGSRNDIFAAKKQGPSFLYQNFDGRFVERAAEYGVFDARQNRMGTALTNILYDGCLGIIIGNWNGYHRAYVPVRHSFLDYVTEAFREPSLVRTVVSANFDNDGFDKSSSTILAS